MAETYIFQVRNAGSLTVHWAAWVTVDGMPRHLVAACGAYLGIRAPLNVAYTVTCKGCVKALGK